MAIYGAFPWTRSLKQHGKQIFTQLIKHRIAENNKASNYREFTTIFAGYLGHIVAAQRDFIFTQLRHISLMNH